MPNTAEITATIIDMLAALELSITPCTGESDCWLVSPDSSGTEILLVLQPPAVASYVGGLIADYLPHEVVDAVGSAPIAEELAWTAAQSLYGALSGAAPGLLTEIGIRNGLEGNGAEVYSIRAMRALLTD